MRVVELTTTGAREVRVLVRAADDLALPTDQAKGADPVEATG
jgi:hypothetical protein